MFTEEGKEDSKKIVSIKYANTFETKIFYRNIWIPQNQSSSDYIALFWKLFTQPNLITYFNSADSFLFRWFHFKTTIDLKRNRLCNPTNIIHFHISDLNSFIHRNFSQNHLIFNTFCHLYFIYLVGECSKRVSLLFWHTSPFSGGSPFPKVDAMTSKSASCSMEEMS